MPQTLTGHDRADVQMPEDSDPGLGFTVRFAGRQNAWPSVFLFDGQMAVIDPATKGAYFDTSLNDIGRVAQMREHSVADVQTIHSDHAPAFVERLGIAIATTETAELTEIVTMGQLHDCMVKIRYTSQLDREGALGAFLPIVEALGRALSASDG